MFLEGTKILSNKYNSPPPPSSKYFMTNPLIKGGLGLSIVKWIKASVSRGLGI